MSGKFCDKNNYRKHLHICLIKASTFNLSRFRMGAWKLKVTYILLKHIDRNNRHCTHCATDSYTATMDDEEHVKRFVRVFRPSMSRCIRIGHTFA